MVNGENCAGQLFPRIYYIEDVVIDVGYFINWEGLTCNFLFLSSFKKVLGLGIIRYNCKFAKCTLSGYGTTSRVFN